MALTQQQHLRLQVMMNINHPEEYYQKAAKSKGIDFHNMTHDQICLWKATLKSIEADIMIESAENMPVTKIDKIEEFISNEKEN